MGLLRFVGNASSFLNGIQAKRVSNNDPCAEISGPQSANSGGGRAARHCGSQDVSLEQTSAVQVVCGACDVEPIARRWEKRPTRCDPKCSQRVGPQISWLETDRLVTEFDTGALETDRLSMELEAGVLENDRPTAVLEAGVLENDRPTAVLETSSSMVRASVRRRRAGESQRGRRAALQAGALFRPVGRRVRAEHSDQRAEAGSDSFDNFVAALHTCENHAIRTDRVNVILHAQHSQNSQTHNSHSTIARSLHGVHDARCVQNSSNSLGDGVVRGRGVCLPEETKSPSMSTRSGVRRSAVYGSAHAQQTPLKLHAETWEGLLRNQGRRFSGK